MAAKGFKIKIAFSISPTQGWSDPPVMQLEIAETVPPGQDAGPYLKERIEAEWKRVMGTRMDLVQVGAKEETG
jgi:hypothetical protein